MSDLIDRQAAIDALKDMYHAAEKWGEETSDDVIKARAESCMTSLIEMKLRIENLPSAQPDDAEANYWHEKANSYEQTLVKLAQSSAEQPKIIRCKDCKHYDPNDHCYLQGAEADDFCSYAERRE